MEDNETPAAPSRRRNFRPLILAIVAVVGIAGIVAGVLILNKGSSTPPTTSSEPTVTVESAPEKTETSTKTEEKEETAKEPEVEPEEPIEGKTPAAQDGDANTLGELTGVINYAASDGETVMIRVSIDQYLESGECLLEMNSPSTGDTFSLPDTITPSAATSTCTYDIATSLLTSGTYEIKITLKSGGKQGIITGEVNV